MASNGASGEDGMSAHKTGNHNHDDTLMGHHISKVGQARVEVKDFDGF